MDSQQPSEGIYLGYQGDNALDPAVIESADCKWESQFRQAPPNPVVYGGAYDFTVTSEETLIDNRGGSYDGNVVGVQPDSLADEQAFFNLYEARDSSSSFVSAATSTGEFYPAPPENIPGTTFKMQPIAQTLQTHLTQLTTLTDDIKRALGRIGIDNAEPPKLLTRLGFRDKFPRWDPVIEPIVSLAISLAYHDEELGWLGDDPIPGVIRPQIITATFKAIEIIIEVYKQIAIEAPEIEGFDFINSFTLWVATGLVKELRKMKYCIRRTVGEYGLQEGRSREENMACAKQWAEGGAFLHWWKPDRSMGCAFGNPIIVKAVRECCYLQQNAITRRIYKVLKQFPSLRGHSTYNLFSWGEASPLNAWLHCAVSAQHNIYEWKDGKPRMKRWVKDDKNLFTILKTIMAVPGHRARVDAICTEGALQWYHEAVMLVDNAPHRSDPEDVAEDSSANEL